MRESAKLLLFAFLPLNVVVSLIGSESEKSWKPWRTAANSGANVLFCFLRVHDVTCEYDELVRKLGGRDGDRAYSATDLVRLAGEKGVELEVVSLTMDELEASQKPVITYMYSEIPDDGGFVLVYNVTASEVLYIDGASATMQAISREDFRRIWSGIALIEPATRGSSWITFSSGLSVAVLGTLLVRCFLHKGNCA